MSDITKYTTLKKWHEFVSAMAEGKSFSFIYESEQERKFYKYAISHFNQKFWEQVKKDQDKIINEKS